MLVRLGDEVVQGKLKPNKHLCLYLKYGTRELCVSVSVRVCMWVVCVCTSLSLCVHVCCYL